MRRRGLLPNCLRRRLDGELWLARGRFEALSGIVRKTEPQDDEWRQIKYMIFELPDAPGTFAERAQRIKEIVADSAVAAVGRGGAISRRRPRRAQAQAG